MAEGARDTSRVGRPGGIRAALFLSLLALPAALGWATYALPEPAVPENKVANRPIQVDKDGYVSSQSCKACHPQQYETWHGSYHRTMTQVATPETVVADFDGARVNSVRGRPMLLERRGTQFWVEFDDPDGTGEPPPRVKRQVVMITGSHNQQIYWYATGRNRLLGQLPAVYLIAERRWIPRRAAVMHSPSEPLFSETGHWNSVCVACHTTNGRPEFDTPFGSQPIETQVVNTTVAEFGISCEACHGPSEEHVRLNRSPQRRYWLHLTRTADTTIVQPSRLNPRLSSQVCGQCHGIWEFYDSAGERQANSAGLPYRPGDDLSRTRFVAQPTENLDSPTMKTLLADDSGFVRDSFWSDGMVRVSGREYNGLIESPCFKNAADAKSTLSCSSCHAMHKLAGDPRSITTWADDQLAPGMESNETCLQCHSSLRANTTNHTKHDAGSAGSSCYNCHMPYTTYGLLKTIRSHQINNPSVRASVETGRPNSCNLCHLDKTLKWTSDYLKNWYNTPEVELSADEQSIAASVIWLLKGDAGQRAIVAQSMGWRPAQESSGTAWMGPYLAQLLSDPYDAVRFIAYRSLRSLPGFAELDYDFVAPSQQRLAKALTVLDAWRRTVSRTRRPGDAQLLFDADGTLMVSAVNRLLKERNNQRVFLRE